MKVTYHQGGYNYQYSIHVLDSKEIRFKTDSKFKEKSKKLAEVLKNSGKLNPNYISEAFKRDKQGKILFNKEVDKQIFDLFINEELRKSLDYSLLSVRLKNKIGGQKRPKI